MTIKDMERRKGRCAVTSAPWGAAPPPEREGAARLPAFHHGSSQGVCGPLVRSGPGFGGCFTNAADMTAGAAPTSRDAPRTPVVMPAGMMPGPPGNRLQACPRAPPLTPPPQLASAAASFTGEMICTGCNVNRDRCQGAVATSETSSPQAVMAGLGPAIHVFWLVRSLRRGCPAIYCLCGFTKEPLH